MAATPTLDLMEFVEREILPRYTQFDHAHNLAHVNSVIRRSTQLAARIGADINMSYVVAAYHDLGLEGPRAIHHLTSGKILAADNRLRRWFSPHQIEMMRQAVEDHRASASHEPRNLYGKIVAEADRNLEPETVIRRTIQFGLEHYPKLQTEGHWRRFLQHMDEKYSVNGYIKLWLSGSDNEQHLRELRQLLGNEPKLREVFDRIYNEETRKK